MANGTAADTGATPPSGARKSRDDARTAPGVAGACLCGEVAFELAGPVTQMAHCHCTMCRKFHGAAFATFGVVAPTDFRWVRGAGQVVHHQSSARGWRHFCPRCGAAAPAMPPGGPFALVPMGNLAEDPGQRPALHFFTASKAPWHRIADDLPCHPEWPPEFGADAVSVARPPRSAPTPGATGGSCLCGAVTFEFDGAPARMVNCHCSRCRRAMSAAYATMMMVPLQAFRWLAGESEVGNYEMPEAKVKGTAFCRSCGSQVARRRDQATMQIPAGCLDDDPPGRPTANIFVGSKAPWAVVDERLPSYPEGPPPAS